MLHDPHFNHGSIWVDKITGERVLVESPCVYKDGDAECVEVIYLRNCPIGPYLQVRIENMGERFTYETSKKTWDNKMRIRLESGRVIS